MAVRKNKSVTKQAQAKLGVIFANIKTQKALEGVTAAVHAYLSVTIDKEVDALAAEKGWQETDFRKMAKEHRRKKQ